MVYFFLFCIFCILCSFKIGRVILGLIALSAIALVIWQYGNVQRSEAGIRLQHDAYLAAGCTEHEITRGEMHGGPWPSGVVSPGHTFDASVFCASQQKPPANVKLPSNVSKEEKDINPAGYPQVDQDFYCTMPDGQRDIVSTVDGTKVMLVIPDRGIYDTPGAFRVVTRTYDTPEHALKAATRYAVAHCPR